MHHPVWRWSNPLKMLLNQTAFSIYILHLWNKSCLTRHLPTGHFKLVDHFRSDEALLIQRLLYNCTMRGKYARPLVDSSNNSKAAVNFGMRLITMDLNEADQTMHTSVWLRIASIFHSSSSYFIFHLITIHIYVCIIGTRVICLLRVALHPFNSQVCSGLQT